jgi:hypothetical protein
MQCGTSLADSLAWHHFSTAPLCSTTPCRESCWDTQNSILLASHIVRVPNSRYRGHEFESLLCPVWQELGALTKVDRSLGSGLSVNMRAHSAVTDSAPGYSVVIAKGIHCRMTMLSFLSSHLASTLKVERSCYNFVSGMPKCSSLGSSFDQAFVNLQSFYVFS